MAENGGRHHHVGSPRMKLGGTSSEARTRSVSMAARPTTFSTPVRALLPAVVAVGLLAGACSSGDSSPTAVSSTAAPASTGTPTATSAVGSTTPGSTTAGSSAPATAPQSGSDLDLTALPLGDQRFSSAPEVGSVHACQTTFNGRGAFAQGPWIDADAGTWNMLDKITVEGEVAWPEATWAETVEGDQRVITSVALPVGHTTGVFPVASDSEAYDYDRNPNTIEAHDTQLSVPIRPVASAEPGCIGGEVGIMTTGVLIYSAFDAAGRDAVATEIQDGCEGHPQAGGFYHYHGPSSCVEEISGSAPGGGHSALQGYAFDGFGIFGVFGEDGVLLSTADLDECHGHTHEIEWDGGNVEMYHYHFTPDFPYTVSCFRAEPQVRSLSTGEGPTGPGGPRP